jgi:hypothetical protein
VEEKMTTMTTTATTEAVTMAVVAAEAVADETEIGEGEQVRLHQEEVVEDVPGPTRLLRSLMWIGMMVRSKISILARIDLTYRRSRVPNYVIFIKAISGVNFVFWDSGSPKSNNRLAFTRCS